jgi:hypothetical protein
MTWQYAAAITYIGSMFFIVPSAIGYAWTSTSTHASIRREAKEFKKILIAALLFHTIGLIGIAVAYVTAPNVVEVPMLEHKEHVYV